MVSDFWKIVIPLFGGSVASFLLSQWITRIGGKTQSIPLIQRGDRTFEPILKGYVLAKVEDSGSVRRLSPLENVRELQFTLRNTSRVHLRDAEIQFDFLCEEVEGWVGRPVMAQTEPTAVDTPTASGFVKTFRWKVPQLPRTDSIDFTFLTAGNASQKQPHVSIDRCDGIIIEKTDTEPKIKAIISRTLVLQVIAFLVAILATFSSLGIAGIGDENHLATANQANCSVSILSAFHRVGNDFWPFDGPWRITYDISNEGSQQCLIQLNGVPGGQFSIAPGQETRINSFSPSRPKLDDLQIGLGSKEPLSTAKITLFGK